MFENDTQRDKQELEAARLTADVQVLLDKAFQSRPDLSVSDIAERIGVTPQRVREVLSLSDKDNLEGNMYVATLARYLRAMGYELKLTAVAVDSEASTAEVNRWRPHRDRIRADHEEYIKTLPGLSFELLHQLDGGSLPFNEYLHAVQAGGYSAKEAMEFIAEESIRGRITVHDDGSVSVVRKGEN